MKWRIGSPSRLRRARAVRQVALVLLLADRQADVGLVAAAVHALAALGREQRDHVVAGLHERDPLAHLLDHAGALVAEDRGGVARGIRARRRVEICVAHAAGLEPHQHLTRARLLELDLLHGQRLPELLENGRAHSASRATLAAHRRRRTAVRTGVHSAREYVWEGIGIRLSGAGRRASCGVLRDGQGRPRSGVRDRQRHGDLAAHGHRAGGAGAGRPALLAGCGARRVPGQRRYRGARPHRVRHHPRQHPRGTGGCLAAAPRGPLPPRPRDRPRRAGSRGAGSRREHHGEREHRSVEPACRRRDRGGRGGRDLEDVVARRHGRRADRGAGTARGGHQPAPQRPPARLAGGGPGAGACAGRGQHASSSRRTWA